MILQFFYGVHIAARIVTDTWPEAQLYKVECSLPHGQKDPVDSGLDIHQLTATFRVGNEGTVKISSLGWWSDWGTPSYSAGSVDGYNDMPWPPAEGVNDLEDAAALLLADPRTPGTFWACQLQEPQHASEGIVQPIYAFTMVDNTTWYVGAKDGNVWPSPVTTNTNAA